MENRRKEDKLMIELDTTVKEMGKDVQLIKQKIFNGYDKSIKSTENKVNYIDEQNRTQHAEIKADVKELSRKVDKLLWKLVGITFFALLSELFLNLTGILK